LTNGVGVGNRTV